MAAATIERERYRETLEPAAAKTTGFIPRRRSYRTALLWAAGGFLAGALFWYAVGFWRFVSDVVLDPAPSAAAEMTAVAPPSPVSLPTIYLVDPANCTALILDRKTNSTVMKACPQEGLALRLEANSERENLAVVGDPAIMPARYRAD
jgi:hypothetical protein